MKAYVTTALLVLPLLIVRARRWFATRRRRGGAMCVAFLHPDLGIGGAERLVVDAAVSLQQRGHSVVMHTAHHDPSRCFEETRDGTLTVRVAGDWLPRTILGRLHIVCATLRAIYGALVLLVTEPACGVVVVDQVSAPVPLLRLGGLVVLFYCHFPDKLLSGSTAAGAAPKGSTLKRVARWLYRLPFDLLEEVTTGCASTVLVNSRYTASVYDRAFPLLRGLRRALALPEPEVLHPCIDLARSERLAWPGPSKGVVRLVSINRFEGKKNLQLALAALRHHNERGARGGGVRVELTLAGGWDPRLRENVECFGALQAEVAAAGLQGLVTLQRNVSEAERRALFERSHAVVYTPSNEHFGIVPLEAMAAARPVIAVNNGGPRESVVHGRTGWLCEPTPDAFARAYEEVAASAATPRLREMGAAARTHVEASFSLEAFGRKLEEYLRRAS